MAAAAVYAAEPSGQPRRILTAVRPDPHTGRLVRTVIASSQATGNRKAAPQGRAALDDAVQVIASRHSLSPELLHSVIAAESDYNPVAVSPKGALGLMQLIPSTARRFGVANVFNPVENIEGGARYLRYLLDLYDGNYRLALAAYNAGERAVEKYHGVPPFQETRNYVNLVGRRLDAAGSPKAAAKPVGDREVHIVEVREPDGSVRYVSR